MTVKLRSWSCGDASAAARFCMVCSEPPSICEELNPNCTCSEIEADAGAAALVATAAPGRSERVCTPSTPSAGLDWSSLTISSTDGSRSPTSVLCANALPDANSANAATSSEEHTSELQSLMRISYA